MSAAFDRFTEVLEAHDCRQGRGWLCPAHDDRNASLSVAEGDDGRVLVKCFAGCSVEEIVAELGLEMRDLFDQPPGGEGGPSTTPGSTAHLHTPDLTVEAYAKAKGLKPGFLREIGLSDYKDQRFPQQVLRIPYRDAEGDEPAVRIRKELPKRPDGTDERFLWRKGSKPLLYGAWRLDQSRAAGHVVIVEGESDAQTLWHHGIPAVGLPGAANWREDRDREHLEGIDRIFVLIEPDKGGEAVLGWLGGSAIRERAWLIQLNGHKDASALHLADPASFTARFEAAMEAAEPWRAVAAGIEDADRRAAASACAGLAREPRILDRLEEALHAVGLAGEERLGKIVYLAATSRVLRKIVSVAVKGPSSVGKSYVVKRVLSFFPDEAYHSLTAMSGRALAFGEEPLEHRMLVLYEAAGMEGEWTTYMIRSLLSEGHIRYEITEKDADGRHVTRLVERPGPTGLIVTTTAVSLHPENETRLISLLANDTSDQTKRVMEAVAEEEEGEGLAELDFEPWHALQRWVALGDARVTIPYRKALGELIPPVAVRLRRDFGALLALIRAHALLHQETRDRDQHGRVVSSLDDYAVVREVVSELISDQVGATVRETTRETVAAVAELLEPEDVEHVTRTAVSRKLSLDQGAGYRRVEVALQAGWLRNLEDRPRRPARLVLGEPLPEEQPLFPDPADLARYAGMQWGAPPRRAPLPPGTAEDTAALFERAIDEEAE